jgi:hypothetical protein
VAKKPTIAELQKALAKAQRTEKTLRKRIAELEGARMVKQAVAEVTGVTAFPWDQALPNAFEGEQLRDPAKAPSAYKVAKEAFEGKQ